MSNLKTVLVIGGGITGLAAMHELHKWKLANESNIRLVLAEASSALGGKIRTEKDKGFLMEAGADSIVARKAQAMTFIQELGLENDVVYNAAGKSFIFTEGELKQIPTDAVFGIPTSLESLAKTPLVTAEGKVEALKDFYTTAEDYTKDDSVGSFLEHCFGKELVEKQIAPVLSGVYSGNLIDLTIGSTLPYLLDYKKEFGSIIKGFEANRETFQGSNGKKFISFKSGLGKLIDAYEEKFSNVEILKDTKVSTIVKTERGYQVSFQNEDVMEADYIVMSIPHTEARKLLKEQKMEELFTQLKTSSLISIYIGFEVPDSVLPADGTGFITAGSSELSCNACTWTSRKWEHTSETKNLLVRLFYKSSHPSYTALDQMNEDQLLQAALEDIQNSLGISAQPVSYEVTKWTDSMPNYLITHPLIIKDLESAIADLYPGIWLAGCSYYGVGIPDCIENGAKIAREVIAHCK